MVVEYPVGGSLTQNHPFYVQRQADSELHDALQAGQFCYVFNSRQMGKSSLLVRSQHQLEQAGWHCCSVDLSSIGSETVTPQQWYKGVAFELWRGFGLRQQLDFRRWWQDESDLPVLQRLQHFISDVLLVRFSENLVIYIDEIDSILSLPFTVDDFFALIRFCYNQRSLNPTYNRISFVLAGVATPTDLIQDKNRTPFNIGRAIELTGFDYKATIPLLQGLGRVVDRPERILREILEWTGGQPFLTQKLCQLAVNTAYHSGHSVVPIPPGTESFWVSTLVRDRILHHWESQDEPEHLCTIRDRIQRQGNFTNRLLGIYQQILYATTDASPILANDSREQIELLLTGLVVKQQGFLRVKNRIYQQIFDRDWVEAQLANLRPYASGLEAWFASGQRDSSRLLRGQALKEAQHWSQGKSLSDRDYQFLAASQECDRLETQQAMEAARLKEVEARLLAEQYRRKQEHRAARLQRLLLLALSLALVIAMVLGFTIRQQYQAAIEREQQTKMGEIRALVASSEGLFGSNRRLDALIAALQAKQQFQALDPAVSDGQMPPLRSRVELVLQQAISGADEYNRFANPPAGRAGLAVSPDGKTIVTAGQNNTLNLWTPDGRLQRTLAGHTGPVLSLAISPTGDRMVSGSSDRTLRLWQPDGTFFGTLEGHRGSVLALAFSPDGETIASGSDDATIKLWRRNGQLIRTLSGHPGAVLSVVFTPTGELISGGEDGTVKLWSSQGEMLFSFKQPGSILRIAIHPNGDKIAAAMDDQTIQLWTREGTLLTTLRGHTHAVNAIAFSPDGQMIASASSDRTIKLWTTDGTLLKTFAGHTAPVTEVAFVTGHDRTNTTDWDLISLSWDNTVRLWHLQNALLKVLAGHTAEVWSVAFSSGGTLLASASTDETARLWQIEQRQELQVKPSTVLTEPGVTLRAVAFSPNRALPLPGAGQVLATAGTDQRITVWKNGARQRSFKAHNGDIRALAFSPNGRYLASASNDSTVKVWAMPSSRDGGPQDQPLPLLSTLRGHESSVLAVAFSRDSRVIASASSDSTVKLWTPDGRLLSTFQRHSLPVEAITFNPVRNLLASAGEDQTILLWQPNGTVLNTLRGHEDSVRAIAFSPNGAQLASGGQDGTIKLWHSDGTLLTTLKGHSTSITSLKFSPDGQLLASASEDSTVLLWDLAKVQSTQQILKYSCHWVREYVQTQLKLPENEFCPLAR